MGTSTDRTRSVRTHSTDQAFDGEFRLFVNWYSGGPNATLPVLGQFGPAY